jgi:hypothetical protein
MMNRDDDAIRRRHSVVLIGSGSSVFIDIVGDMIGECGFEVTTPAPAEPPWLSVTRTQPVLVICDCMGPELNVKRLIVETVARRLPLLIVAAVHEQVVACTWPLPDCVAWLEFPIARDRFRTTIDELMTPRRTIMQRSLMLHGAGVTIETAITVRTLDGAPFETRRLTD